MKYAYIFLTILFTVSGQILAKWRLSSLSENMPYTVISKMLYLLVLPFKDIGVLFVYIFAFLASLFWFMTLNKMPLSVAYPYMSLAFLAVIFISAILFKETLNIWTFVGAFFLVIGLFFLSKGV